LGEGHLGLVERVSHSKPSILYIHFNRFHRHIFGSLPTNVDEEDVLQPVISTLSILKEQRARKAAARQQAAEDIPTDALHLPEHNTHDFPPAQPEPLEDPDADDSVTEDETQFAPNPQMHQQNSFLIYSAFPCLYYL
jgi:hypothetical protein